MRREVDAARITPDMRVCLWDSLRDRKKVWLSCNRLALPGRNLCHKHAGTHKQYRRRRARNKVARATRKAQR